MKLAAVVIWFNPLELGEDKIIKNVLSYGAFCDKVYIVDNRQALHEELSKKIPGCVYLSNKNEGGIAGAQNKGCQMALSDGYEWAMTMDQDSYFESEQIKKYIHLVDEYIPTDEKAVSFGPKIVNLNETVYWTKQIRFKILSPIKRKILGKKWKPRTESEVLYPKDIIASGNIINLSVWKDNTFDELLFIDEVDHNFCHRLIRKGYKIVMLNKAYLNQYFGTKTFALFKKNYGNYSDFRLFYIFRNHLIEAYRFPEYRKEYIKTIKMHLFDVCINSIHPVKHFKIFIKAYNEYKVKIRDL